VALQPGANLTLQGASGTTDEQFGGTIGGSGSLTKRGSYIQWLTGMNTYAGGTNVEGGSLGIDDATGLGSNTGLVSFENGGTLLVRTEPIALSNPLQVIAGSSPSDGQVQWYDSGVAIGGHTVSWAPAGITGNGELGVDLKGLNGAESTFEINQDTTIDPAFAGFRPAEFTEIKFAGSGEINFGLIGSSGVFDADGSDVRYDSTVSRDFGGTLKNVNLFTKEGAETLTFDSDSTITAQTVIVDAGVLAIENGDVTVSGGTTVDGGILQLDATSQALKSAVTVSGGELQAVGTIDGDLVNEGPVGAGGTVQVGSESDPYGDLVVTGEFDNNGGAVQVEMQQVGGGYDVSTIQVSGKAQINDGSLVVNAAEGTPFVVDDKIPFIVASPVVVTTDFSLLTLTGGSHSGRYALEPYHTGTDYGFVIKAGGYYQGIEHFTHNNLAMGDYFSAQTASGISPKSPDMNTVTSTILGLADQAPAYDQLDGALFGSASSAGVQATSNMFRVIGNHLRPNAMALCPAPTAMARYGRTDNESLFRHGQAAAASAWSGWAAVARLDGDANSDGNAHGFAYTQNGGLVGVQRNLDFESNLGMFFSYSQSTIDVRGLDDRVTTENNFGGVYLTRDYGLGYSMVVAGGGQDQYESRREISFLGRRADGNHDGWQAGIYTEHGLTFGLSNLFFQPYGALQYVYLGQDGFTETGASSVNLVVDDSSFNSFRMLLGGRLAGSFWGPTWELRAQWIHELLSETAPVVNAGFQGGWDPTFAIEGASLGRDWALLGAGVDWQILPRCSVFANYDWQVNAYQSFGVGSAGAEFRW
ncbi:MAG: autotransporter domain-containing protein, partial [Mariniblastus sp.]|nr:autotransporter domain-containing protein [Mariniblastus sp.]